MKRTLRSSKICPKSNDTPPQKKLSEADSTASTDTEELVERSRNIVRELSSFLEKDSCVREVNRPFSTRRCKVESYSSRKRNHGETFVDVPFCRPNTQSTGRQSQNPGVAVNQKNAKANGKPTSEEKPCLQPTPGKVVNVIRTISPSMAFRSSKGKLQSYGLYCESSDEESNEDEDDEYDDEIKMWFESVQSHYSCVSKDGKGGMADFSQMIKYILQTFQMATERYPQTKAVRILKQNFKYLPNCKKYLGMVPGVEVGGFFYDKMELSIIGLHNDLHSEISCIEHNGNIVAASVMASGFHYTVLEEPNILIYPGFEGYPGYHLKNGKFYVDRKFEIGILALKNSIEACTPVRVIYNLMGEKSRDSHVSKPKKVFSLSTYIYDGLYMVEKYWFVSRGDGFSIYNFQLRRKPEQPNFEIKELMKAGPSRMRFGMRMVDISEGKEKKPVSIVNIIDSNLPDPFTYIVKMMYPPRRKLKTPRGCDCINGCSDSVRCACVTKNGGELPFNCDGAIVRARPLVYECGPACKCPPSCQNRVSQLGFEYRLEIFKTRSRGWGVRSLDKIPSGSFVCEYIGEMLEDAEAGKRMNDEYLFDIGTNYHDEELWEGLPSVPTLKNTRSGGRREAGFTIDAVKFGNLGRFINHCCTPNLYAQNVLFDHDDHRLPHIMLFASEDIFPFEELTYHYNYCIDGVLDADGNIRKKECFCGSDECAGRLY